MSKYRNLNFLNRKLHVNKPNSTQWMDNCHFMYQSHCLHVKGSRKFDPGCVLLGVHGSANYHLLFIVRMPFFIG